MITIYFHTIYSFILYLRNCRSLNLLFFQMMKLEFSPSRKLKKKGLNDRHHCLHGHQHHHIMATIYVFIILDSVYFSQLGPPGSCNN